MDQHIAVGVALVALALLVAAYLCAHHYFSARVGQAYLAAHWAAPGGASTTAAVFATETERAALRAAWRETVRHADEQYCEWTVWAVVVAVFTLLLIAVAGGLNYFGVRGQRV